VLPLVGVRSMTTVTELSPPSGVPPYMLVDADHPNGYGSSMSVKSGSEALLRC
jgi:hypothetical protein